MIALAFPPPDPAVLLIEHGLTFERHRDVPLGQLVAETPLTYHMIQQAIKSGRFPARRCGRQWFVSSAEIAAALRDGTLKPRHIPPGAALDLADILHPADAVSIFEFNEDTEHLAAKLAAIGLTEYWEIEPTEPLDVIAERLGVGLKTIYAVVRRGGLPEAIKLGRDWHVAPSAVLQAIEDGRILKQVSTRTDRAEINRR